MTDVEAELRAQLEAVLEDATFPVSNQMELVPALPDGITTTFEAGDTRFSAMELSSELGEYQSFPYETPEELVDDVMEGLRAEGMV